MNRTAAFLAVLWLASTALAVSESTLQKKATVFVTSAQLEDFYDTVQYPGRLRSKINAWMISESPGLVQKIVKPVGSRVFKGDVVLIIKNIDPVFKYAPVKILSPANGFVTGLEVDLLSRVDRGDKLFSVTDPQNLWVETEIPAADLHYFTIGQEATFRDSSGHDVRLAVHSLSPAVDIKTGTASALLSLSSSADKESDVALQNLRQGQLGQVVFHVNSRRSFVLPESVLVARGGATFVRVLHDNKAKLMPVKIAMDSGDKVEIQQGLSPGDQVITHWNRFISDDEEVDVQTQQKDM